MTILVIHDFLLYIAVMSFSSYINQLPLQITPSFWMSTRSSNSRAEYFCHELRAYPGVWKLLSCPQVPEKNDFSKKRALNILKTAYSLLPYASVRTKCSVGQSNKIMRLKKILIKLPLFGRVHRNMTDLLIKLHLISINRDLFGYAE